MSPIAHPTLDLFLIGFNTAASLTAALFFLRFWRETRDVLFLAFTGFFAVQAIHNTALLGLAHPNEGNAWLFALRLLTVLTVVAAILRKNFGRR